MSFPARRSALRALLSGAGVDAVLVTDLINVRYLTGFTGSNAALLVHAGGDGASRLCTDGRYRTQAAAEVPDLETLIERACAVELATRARALGVERLGFESDAVTVDAHDAIAAAAEGLPELLAAGGLRPGRTEREVALDLEDRMRRLGATGPAFDTILAAGANSAVPHHRPTDAVLQRGDLLKLDFGALVEGYHSDMTRTVVLGPAAGWQRELHALVAEAQAAGRAALAPGAEVTAVDAAARDVVERAGRGEEFVHGLGHGVGLQIHEDPYVGKTGTGALAAGMVVTVEPGVYLEGRGGVRIEDTLVVREEGPELLTHTTRELLEV
jgi:Xaa-Pro aminopeptidase